MGDQLGGRKLVGRQRENPREQLEPDAVGATRCDVLEIALREESGAVLVADDDLVLANPDDAAVAGEEPVIDSGVDGAAGVAVRDIAEHELAVVRVQELDEEPRVGEPLGLRVAEQPLHLGADVDRRAELVELVDVDDEGELLDDRTEVDVCHQLCHRTVDPTVEGLKFVAGLPTTKT